MSEYDEFFSRVTANARPYAYQRKLAAEPVQSGLLAVPTGAGKTAAVMVAWLWRRRVDPGSTPRKLVYCLPMRVLVEQTVERAREWVKSAGMADEVGVHVLMGGEVDEAWELYPERPAILVGTQDMLLSRALNRGYGMSPYRWPVHFGLLNNDCLWVLDEVQLMGVGLSTATQLEALRRVFGVFGEAHTVWMSATLDPQNIRTVDFAPHLDALAVVGLSASDLKDEELAKRLNARKSLRRAPPDCATAKGLAEFVLANHRSRTLVILNRVERAREVFDALERRGAKEVALLHSRFRPLERRAWRLDAPVVVATQVIEAGMDLSCETMVTDLAPYASMVQRFGRCNRAGEHGEAHIWWVDWPLDEKYAAPYELKQLEDCAALLEQLDSAMPSRLPEHPQPPTPGDVLRRRDVLDLFDTTRDLAGHDIDVSRFVRSGEEQDVLVAWRPPGTPERDELCAVPIGEVRAFLKKHPAKTWDGLAGEWSDVDLERLRPGMIVLVDPAEGGYDPRRGWDPAWAKSVPVVDRGAEQPEAMDDEPLSRRDYRQALEAHAREVRAVAEAIAQELDLGGYLDEFLAAARQHDLGKAHPVFQATMGRREGEPPLAKSTSLVRHARPGFRHELASALALMEQGASDLTAYLAACHHGKVRLSIRAMPNERPPDDGERRFARGVYDGEVLPGTPEIVLRLDAMELGRGSWTDRMLRLRDRVGVFRLAYLEAVIRAADRRSSAEPKGVLG